MNTLRNTRNPVNKTHTGGLIGICLLVFSGIAGCLDQAFPPGDVSGWTVAPPPISHAYTATSTSFDIQTLPTRRTLSPRLTDPATSTPTFRSTLLPIEGRQPVKQPAHTPTVVSTNPGSTPVPLVVDWKTLPVLPVFSAKSLEIYRKGIETGNNPKAFAKIGDCESTPTWFLGDFDKDTRYYDLGEYSYLADVIEYYRGSFARDSVAARRGANASSILAPSWADPTQCRSGESPLACEYRIQRPSVALITLGTNDVWRIQQFEPRLREIIEFTIKKGTIPVLATKADNLEGDHSINATIARLAMEYEIPLWNFWLAVQPLPARGLQPDGAHLTWAPNFFDRYNLQNAWPVRNLNALQILYLLQNELKAR